MLSTAQPIAILCWFYHRLYHGRFNVNVHLWIPGGGAVPSGTSRLNSLWSLFDPVGLVPPPLGVEVQVVMGSWPCRALRLRAVWLPYQAVLVSRDYKINSKTQCKDAAWVCPLFRHFIPMFTGEPQPPMDCDRMTIKKIKCLQTDRCAILKMCWLFLWSFDNHWEFKNHLSELFYPKAPILILFTDQKPLPITWCYCAEWLTVSCTALQRLQMLMGEIVLSVFTWTLEQVDHGRYYVKLWFWILMFD